MTTIERVREEYDAQAVGYNTITDLPCNILETQLLESALGDLSGLVVLDLGGGTGLHARQALALGAKRVDVVDLSPEMLRVGEEEERKAGRSGRIRWFEADTSKPLHHLPLGPYDLVMSNFMFDNAKTMEQLEGMWANAVAFLKPGGRFVGARVQNPRSAGVCSGKYGVTYKDHVDVPGGMQYTFVIHLKEPITFVSSSLEVCYSGSNEVAERFGLVDFEIEPLESARTIREDAEFWSLFVEEPSMAVVKARKPLGASI